MKLIHTYISFILITCLSFAFSPASAQVGFITDGTVQNDDAARPAVSILLRAEPKMVKKAWKDFLEDTYDYKVDGLGFLTNKDILTAERVYLPNQRDHRVTLYAEAVEAAAVDSAQTRFSVFAAYGYDMYVNRYEYNTAYNSLHEMMRSFLDVFMPNYYEQKVNEATEIVADLTDERADLKDETMDLKSDIQSNRDEIEMLLNDIDKMEKEIQENTTEVSELEQTLRVRKAKLEALRVRYQATLSDEKN